MRDVRHCLVKRLQSANYRNFDLPINYPGDKETGSTDYDLIYGRPETLVAELDSAVRARLYGEIELTECWLGSGPAIHTGRGQQTESGS